MSSSDLLNLIRDNLSSAVPFASHVGVILNVVEDGSAQAELPEQPSTLNHLGTAHAGAMYTLAETASGAAMAGIFAEQIFDVRPIVKTAKMTYLKVGRGNLTAHATSREPGSSLRTDLESQARIDFVVDVAVTNADGAEVAQFEAEWVVSKLKKP
jgi:uncharacterized protein (TIGR00369 family)